MTFTRALGIGLLILAFVALVIVLSGCAILFTPDVDPTCPRWGGCDPVSRPVPGLDLNGFGVMP